MANQTTYRHYILQENGLSFTVFDPRWIDSGPIYHAPSLDAAKNWIDGYRDGVQWAVDAALEFRMTAT